MDALADGRVGQTRIGAAGEAGPQLALLHLADAVLIDVWILALTPECLLILIRVVLWRRFGCLAGLVMAANVQVWSHGVRTLDLVALADHLAGLFRQGQLPPGGAPVLVTGTTRDDIDAVVGLLAQREVPFAERARLRPVPCTLSERGATKGFKLREFLTAPSREAWRTVKLVQRAKLAHDAAGQPGGYCRRITEATEQGAAFRRLVYPPVAA